MTIEEMTKKAKEDANASLKANGAQMTPNTYATLSLNKYDIGEKPEQEQFSYYKNLATQFMTKPVDEAEQRRRERQAQATSAIGHLGNTLSSFSNLIFSGQGAPSQALPEAPNADLKSFQDRLDEQRSKYTDAIAKARQLDSNEYETAHSRWLEGKKYNDAVEASNAESENEAVKFEYGRSQDAIANDQKQRQLEQSDKQLAETIRHNKESEANARYSAETTRNYYHGVLGGNGDSDAGNPVIVVGGEQYESLLGNKPNAATIASLISNSGLDDKTKSRLKYFLENNNSNADMGIVLSNMYNDPVAGAQFTDFMISNGLVRKKATTGNGTGNGGNGGYQNRPANSGTKF